MNKYAIVILSNLIMSCALANPFSGAYVTGALGGISTDFQLRGNASLTAPTEGVLFNLSNNSNAYANRIFGSIGLGYAYAPTCRNFIVGMQADANFFNTHRTQRASFSEISLIFEKSKINVQLKNSYDILFRPGLIMDPSTLLYGLIGVSFGNFHASQAANFTEIGEGINVNTNTRSSKSSWKTGYTVGLGVQQCICNNLSAALEYSYTGYRNLSLTPHSSAPVVLDGAAIATLHGKVKKFKAFTNSVSLRLYYNFF